MDRDRGRRYDDGEIIRYGAGESWRPTPRGDRSPRRPRSPRTRSPRPRSPVIPVSDSYVPGRYQGRRRSRSGGDRYRRERSRDRESPRRRERSRSSFRRSPARRSPPPRRSPPRHESRYDRPRSPPRREWGGSRDQGRERDRDWGRDRGNGSRDREFERRADRRRSRSPYEKFFRDRNSPERRPYFAIRGTSHRPRSRSPGRRDDRYQPPRRVSTPRDKELPPASVVHSHMPSEKASPQSESARARSPKARREVSPHRLAKAAPTSRDESRTERSALPQSNTSPPNGLSTLRVKTTGTTSESAASSPGSAAQASRPQNSSSGGVSTTPRRRDSASPTIRPSGPRVFAATSRGGNYSRGGRGGRSQPPSRQVSGLSPSSSSVGGSSAAPTGPRGTSTPTQSRPFNPPTGPSSAQHGSSHRPSLTQSLLATMPAIVPGGKLESSMLPLTLGVTRDFEARFRKLRDEEEKIREELRTRQEKARKGLYVWNRLGRESRSWELRSDLSEKSMKNLAGDGIGGAAF